jgi:hypothetical protein
MMKTKITLFVAVLAAALFGVGCASTPKGPPVPHAVEWDGHWYAFFPEGCNWETAKKKCERLGGHPAYVESESENDFILSLVEKSNYRGSAVWLGGTDEKEEGDWFWLNGKPITNPFWEESKPDNGNSHEHYLIMVISGKDISRGKWNDVYSGGLLGVICEWE